MVSSPGPPVRSAVVALAAVSAVPPLLLVGLVLVPFVFPLVARLSPAAFYGVLAVWVASRVARMSLARRFRSVRA